MAVAKRPAVSPVSLVVAGMVSVQVGAALATSLFAAVGVTGSVLLRVGCAAIVLSVLWRPRLRGRSRADLAHATAFGLVLGAMNLAFYGAIDRIPLGTAVALEFVGPLGVAAWGSRHGRDLVWVGLAAAGIVALAPVGGGSLDPVGVALALLAGGLWAAYIGLSVRVGRAFEGGSGLALAMLVGAVALAPVGVAGAGVAALLQPGTLAVAALVGVLSSAIPYALELEALRTLAPRVFGVLLSAEPVIATVVGLVVLGDGLAARELAAIGCIVVASVGATRRAGLPA